ncbi:hypothetical protein MK280_03060 [Myxococcota bacterium]|nr:hypothetical protein [Myxococcota bacterium]
MSSQSDPSRPRTRLPRLTILDSPELPDNHSLWRLEFRVRGQLVYGTLHTVEPLDPDLGLVVWVHAGSEMPGSRNERPAGTILLELHWPLLGPRQSPKLTPIITACLTGADVSPNQEIFWQQFTQQAVGEIEQALDAIRDQQDVPVGPLVELRLDIESAPNTIQRQRWRRATGQASGSAEAVRDFLEGLRPSQC